MNAIRKPSRSRRLPTIAVSAAVLLSVALSACGKKEEEGGAPPPGAGGGPEVTVAPARVRVLSDREEFPGRLEAVETVQVRSRVTGYLESIRFEQGAEVRRGDLLATIDARPFQTRVQQAEGELAALQSRIDLSKLELARAEKLLTAQASSQQEVDQKAAQVKDLTASLKSAQAALESARLDLGYTRITAPISGRAGRFDVTVGNLIQTGLPDAPVITTIVSVNPIYVSFDIDEQTFVRFGLRGASRKKLPVEFALAGETGFNHQAMLTFVDNRVDPETGGVRARAVVGNVDGALTPGLYARVRLPDPTGERAAIVVPSQGIGTDQDRKYVMVVGADKKATYRPVKVGPVVDGDQIVTEGLTEGEQVIVNGLLRVRPGQPVTAKQAAAPAAAKP